MGGDLEGPYVSFHTGRRTDCFFSHLWTFAHTVLLPRMLSPPMSVRPLHRDRKLPEGRLHASDFFLTSVIPRAQVSGQTWLQTPAVLLWCCATWDKLRNPSEPVFVFPLLNKMIAPAADAMGALPDTLPYNQIRGKQQALNKGYLVSPF